MPLPRADNDKSQVFRVDHCPIHDTERRHIGLDTLLGLMAENGLRLHRTAAVHPWGGPDGLIAADDVVLIKVNAVWSCRGITNTDIVRGLIHRILEHPDGFSGEVVIFENGQGSARFDGRVLSLPPYNYPPEIEGQVHVNAEEETLLSIDYLVDTVFAGEPVSSYLLDPIRTAWITESDHTTDGYRILSDVSYPCFTTAGGHRVELREGVWDGATHGDNLRLLNVPVLKHHDENDPNDTGITGAVKHCYGTLSMEDGQRGPRHYAQSGNHPGKMYSLVRAPDLNIVDAIWVPHETIMGWPMEKMRRVDIVLGGVDPVALDYHCSRHVVLPLAGAYADRHDPDTWPGLIRHLGDARDVINANGGIGGGLANTGDENIELIQRSIDPTVTTGVVLG